MSYRLWDARSGELIGSTVKGDENGLYDSRESATLAAQALNEFVYDNTFGSVIPRTRGTTIKGPFYVRSV